MLYTSHVRLWQNVVNDVDVSVYVRAIEHLAFKRHFSLLDNNCLDKCLIYTVQD